MKPYQLLIAALALSTPVSFIWGADNPENEPKAAPAEYGPAVELKELLAAVTKQSGKRFLVADRVRKLVQVGPMSLQEITYPMLLAILRNNGLAAAPNQGLVTIVPEPNIRLYTIPTVNQDDPNVLDDEWVSRVLPLEHIEAAQTIPIFRPLMPQAGHLAAFAPRNAVLLVDRYGNVRRLTELLKSLDKPSPAPTK